MPRPEVIVFDLGKVMVDFDYSIAARRIAARSRLQLEGVRQCLEQGTLQVRYENGHLTTPQFYEAVVEATGFQGGLEEFSLFFADIFTPIQEMIELHGQLRQLGFPTYVFSNTNDLAITHIRANYPFYQLFTDHVLSYEHGSMKPETKLYEVVEARTGRQGSAILYIDDRLENIEAGRSRHWQVILQESPEKTRKEIQHLGLLKE